MLRTHHCCTCSSCFVRNAITTMQCLHVYTLSTLAKPYMATYSLLCFLPPTPGGGRLHFKFISSYLFSTFRLSIMPARRVSRDVCKRLPRSITQQLPSMHLPCHLSRTCIGSRRKVIAFSNVLWMVLVAPIAFWLRAGLHSCLANEQRFPALS